MIGSGSYVRRPDLLWRRTSSQLLLLQPGTTRLAVLDGTATELWDLLAAPIPFDTLVAELAVRHDADPDLVAADLASALADLVGRGLVESDGPT